MPASYPLTLLSCPFVVFLCHVSTSVRLELEWGMDAEAAHLPLGIVWLGTVAIQYNVSTCVLLEIELGHGI